MSEYRFHVGDDGKITRGRVIHTGGDYETWRNYWDADGVVAFYDERRYGLRALDGPNDTEVARAMQALRMARVFGQDEDAALKRVAERILRVDGERDPERGDFLRVPLRPNEMDLYVLIFDATTVREIEPTYASEIQAVWNGEVYSIEAEEYVPETEEYIPDGGLWLPVGTFCMDLYGAEQRDRTFVNMFPLSEFPAERTVSSDQ